MQNQLTRDELKNGMAAGAFLATAIVNRMRKCAYAGMEYTIIYHKDTARVLYRSASGAVKGFNVSLESPLDSMMNS